MNTPFTVVQYTLIEAVKEQDASGNDAQWWKEPDGEKPFQIAGCGETYCLYYRDRTERMPEADASEFMVCKALACPEQAMRRGEDATTENPVHSLADSGIAQGPDPAAQLLRGALEIVTGARRKDYGNPEDNFGVIAELWDVYLKRVGKLPGGLASWDVAVMMSLMKIARLIENPSDEDSWKDLAGYAACGHRCTVMPAWNGGENNADT